MGQVPTRWSCAFTLGREEGCRALPLPGFLPCSLRTATSTTGSGISFKLNKGQPSTEEFAMGFWNKMWFLSKTNGSWNQGGNYKANHKAHPSKSGQERLKLDISPFTKEFSKGCENVVGEEVCARTTPAIEASLGNVQCKSSKSLAGRAVFLISGSAKGCISPEVNQQHVYTCFRAGPTACLHSNFPF